MAKKTFTVHTTASDRKDGISQARLKTGSRNTAGDSHSHDNKVLLDSFESDDELYLYIKKKLGQSSEATLNKIKAGYADNSGKIEGLSLSDLDARYLLMSIFNLLFEIHYDEHGDIESLEVKTNLFTQGWLSAFGPSSTEGGEGGASILAELLDVIASATNPELVKGLTGDPEEDNGKVLTYSSEDDGWVATEGGQGGGDDKNYTHTQGTSATTWSVLHNLGKYPSVTIVDSSGNEIVGEVKHNSVNDLTVTFSTAISGKVYCN